MRIYKYLLLVLLLSGCGTAPAWLATSAGTYSEYKVVSFSKAGIDLGLSAADLPTTNDVILSKIIGKECKVSKILKGEGLEAVCKEINVFPPEDSKPKKE